MKNPYQRDKRSGRIAGGAPKDVIVGEAAGVKGQQVTPDKVAMSSKPGSTVKMGKSSSFKTSTGLVNMLDVVNQTGQIMQKADKLTDQIDNHRMTEMDKEVAALTKSDEWTNVENPDYISDEDKHKSIADIHNGYENNWLNDSSRAKYDHTVAKQRVAYAQFGFDRDMADVAKTKQTDIEGGMNPDEAALKATELYADLAGKYKDDQARRGAIETAKHGDAARYAAAVAESSTTAFNSWSASGGQERIIQGMAPAMGYEEGRQTALADMAANNQDNPLGQAMWNSYNEDTGQFEGPYADMITQQLDTQLQPMYNHARGMKVQQHVDMDAATVGRIPTQAAIEAAGHMKSDPTHAIQRTGDNFGQMLAINASSARTMAPGQKLGGMYDFFSKFAGQVFKTNPATTNDEFSAVVDDSIEMNRQGIADALGLDPESEKLEDHMVRLKANAKASLTAARDNHDGAVDRASNDELKALTAPTNNTEEVKRQIKMNSVYQLATGAAPGGVATIYTSDGMGQRLTGETRNAMASRGMSLIFSAGVYNGRSAADIQKDTVQWGQRLRAFEEDPALTADGLTAFLQKKIDGGPFTVQADKTGNINIQMHPDHQGNPSDGGKAAFAALLPHLRFNPDKGTYDPTGKINAEASTEIMGSMLRSGFRGTDSRVTPDGMEAITRVIEMSRSIYSPSDANSLIASVITTQVTSDLGQSITPERKEFLQATIDEALDMSPDSSERGLSRVFEAVDDVLGQRDARMLLKTGYTLMDQPAFVGNTKFVLAAALHFTPKGLRPDAENLGVFDWMASGIHGVNDDTTIEQANRLDSAGSTQRMIDIGSKAGVLTVDPGGNVALMPKYENDPFAGSQALYKAISAKGWTLTHHKDSEGNVTEISMDAPPSSYGYNPVTGELSIETGRTVPVDYSADFATAFLDTMEVREKTWTEELGDRVDARIGGSPTDVGHARRIHKLMSEADQSRLDVFEYSIRQMGNATGRSPQQVEDWMDSPANRQQLADNTRAANALWMDADTTRSERKVLDNQIDETLAVFHDAGIMVEPEDIHDLRVFQQQPRGGNMGDNEMWRRTQDIAKAQGFDPNNPPMFSVKIAILETLQPDLAKSIRNISPFDIDAERGFQPYGEDEVASNRRGYDRRVRFATTNFQIPGHPDPDNMNIPIFAPIITNNTRKGDPRTFVRRTPGVNAREAMAAMRNEMAAGVQPRPGAVDGKRLTVGGTPDPDLAKRPSALDSLYGGANSGM